MKQWAQKQTGFTIVELLIVIVVIAILASVTIVSYNGIRQRAAVSALQSALSQADKKAMLYITMNGAYPQTLADLELTNSDSTYFQYSVDTSGTEPQYALSVSDGAAGSTSFYISSTQRNITSGIAPGHNLVAWNESDEASVPVTITSGVAIDTSVSRSGPASVRISPTSPSKTFRSSPVSGIVGQVVTVSFWMRTDSNWNGTGSNSKIRFGASGGGLLSACSYNGVKTSWTFVTCSRTLTSSDSTVVVSVGNDGSTGNIWLDDISLSVQ